MEISNTQNTYQKPRNLAGLGRRWGGQIIDSLVTLFLFGLVGRTAEVIGLPPSMLGMSVIDERSYLNCNLYQSFMRNITTPFLNVFDWIFIFFGSRKRLGDMLASTIVIRSKP
jgi:uncharacterized RDD family membrane protein YckC